MNLLLIALAGIVSSVTAADSTRWIVSNHGREAGELTVVTRGDSVFARYIFTDRNRGTRLETRYKVGADGKPLSGESRSVLADLTLGEPSDAFTLVADSVRTGVARGGTPSRTVFRAPGSIVMLRASTPWEQATLARDLLARPGRRGVIAGGAVVSAEVIADTVLRAGALRQRARLVMVRRGTSPTPSGVWLDEKGELLSTDVQWFITVRPSAVPLMPALRAIELRWRNAQAEALATQARVPVQGALVIRNGNLFDSERGTMVPGQTVVVQGDRIVAVGADASVAVPSGATIIDATGKTIMPGMWEMHTHLQVSSQGPLGLIQLSRGLTTARDLAADTDVAVSQRDRERQGRLAGPRIILAGFMEGPLRWAGPSATLVSTEAEARAWVARYDSLGYKQVKLYNVAHPDLVPTIAEEAHKRGMLVSGHIPRGMSMQAAVALGYDEVQHAAFFFSNWFPDSLYVPTMRAYSQVATVVAPTYDVNSAEMTRLLAFLKERRTVIDGTFNLWIGGGASSVGSGPSPSQARADSAYMTLIRRLYAEGIPLVAGTDNSAGTTYQRELEMYERAGIPVAKILQIATIDAARFMKEDRDYGSVSVGKVADILVVNGNPSQRIGELSKIETVVRGGRLYRVPDLLRLSGAGPAAPGGAEGDDGHGGGHHWH